MPSLRRSLSCSLWRASLAVAACSPPAFGADEPGELAVFAQPLIEGAVTAEPAPLRWGVSLEGAFLRLRAGVELTPGEREHRYGLFELGLPVEGWLGAGAPPVFALAAGAESSAGAPPAAERESRGAGELGASEGRAGRSAPLHRERSSRGVLTPALARKAVAIALSRLGSASALGRLDAMASRSRAAASLPEVRLGAGTSRDDSMRFAPTLADPARFTRDGKRDLWLEARLTWRLDRALFSNDELAVERLKAQHRDERARVTREVLDALLDWQRARSKLALELLSPEERAAAELAELGALARLDVATGGWFSRQLAARAALPPGSEQVSLARAAAPSKAPRRNDPPTQ